MPRGKPMSGNVERLERLRRKMNRPSMRGCNCRTMTRYLKPKIENEENEQNEEEQDD